MSKIAVRYHPVAEIRRAMEILGITGQSMRDAHRIESNTLRQSLRVLAPFVPKLLYENKGKFVPQASRGSIDAVVTRPEVIQCAGLLREVSIWLRVHANDAVQGCATSMCQHADRLELIAAYLPETIDPLHWPLVQQAPNPNGEIRVSNLSGLL